MALRALARGDAAGHNASQSMRAQLQLRASIVAGALPPGERLTELALVERLAMSRTPIRAALVRLQEEGLLEPLPGGGFVVRSFSEQDILDAIELRGTLEGLAARRAAERGVPGSMLAEARELLARIDALLTPPKLSDSAFAAYAEGNGRLHALLAEMSGSPLLQRQIERAASLPFASPNGFLLANRGAPRARDHLLVAHAQHHALIDAIVHGEGARAEALAREHARNARHSLTEVLAQPSRKRQVDGAAMLRRRAAVR